VSKPRRKLQGRPTFDDQGNAVWTFAGEGGREVETESVQALAEGLSLESPSQNQKGSPDPYNQTLAEGKERTRGRSLDDMRRLNEQMKREREAHVRKLRSGHLESHSVNAGPIRSVRLRLRFDDRELLADEDRSSILIGRADDNDMC
jgi:hypothetical protein